MAKNPLQDQLLKAGLTNKHAVNQANKQKQKQTQQGEALPSLGQQALAEKAARDKALAEEQKEALRKRELAAQIRQIIEHSRISREKGEVAYNFTDGKSVKKIYVTDKLLNQLSHGLLAVVKLGEGYEVVPAKVAEKIRERDASVVVSYHEAAAASDEDDPYKDYQIPDDLMW
ncbi:MAG TPA: DUF2058 domain-containing protein [Pseudomonadales bacterium]|nr:DUF2058 domain-containing protein [Pseudomonadales bacterium]